MRMMRYLRGRRRRLKMTQVDVAAAMGTSQDEVSRLERGLVDPHIRTIASYIRALQARPRIHARLAVPHLDCELKNEIHGPHPVRELSDRTIVCYGAPDPDIEQAS